MPVMPLVPSDDQPATVGAAVGPPPPPCRGLAATDCHSQGAHGKVVCAEPMQPAMPIERQGAEDVGDDFRGIGPSSLQPTENGVQLDDAHFARCDCAFG